MLYSIQSEQIRPPQSMIEPRSVYCYILSCKQHTFYSNNGGNLIEMMIFQDIQFVNHCQRYSWVLVTRLTIDLSLLVVLTQLQDHCHISLQLMVERTHLIHGYTYCCVKIIIFLSLNETFLFR